LGIQALRKRVPWQLCKLNAQGSARTRLRGSETAKRLASRGVSPARLRPVVPPPLRPEVGHLHLLPRRRALQRIDFAPPAAGDVSSPTSPAVFSDVGAIFAFEPWPIRCPRKRVPPPPRPHADAPPPRRRLARVPSSGCPPPAREIGPLRLLPHELHDRVPAPRLLCPREHRPRTVCVAMHVAQKPRVAGQRRGASGVRVDRAPQQHLRALGVAGELPQQVGVRRQRRRVPGVQAQHLPVAAPTARPRSAPRRVPERWQR